MEDVLTSGSRHSSNTYHTKTSAIFSVVNRKHERMPTMQVVPSRLRERPQWKDAPQKIRVSTDFQRCLLFNTQSPDQEISTQSHLQYAGLFFNTQQNWTHIKIYAQRSHGSSKTSLIHQLHVLSNGVSFPPRIFSHQYLKSSHQQMSNTTSIFNKISYQHTT